MKKLKKMALKAKFGVMTWALDRKSNEETAGKGTWIFATLMIILIVVGILLAGSQTGYTNIIDMFVKTTEGTKTPVGEWTSAAR